MILEQDANTLDHLLPDAWMLQMKLEDGADVQAGLDHEWLVTNGIGGYASGSIVGATTRSYHGLLVAALRPPVQRMVLVTKIDEEVMLPGGELLKLGVNEYLGGTLDPQGYTYLKSVSLEGDIPCFTYHLNNRFKLEKRVWMEYGQNTTYVQYALHEMLDEEEIGQSLADVAEAALTLRLIPFCLSRDYHETTQGSPGWRFLVENGGNRCRVRAYEGAPAYHLLAPPGMSFSPTDLWYWRVFHRREHERGLLDHEDVYQPGIFQTRLQAGMRVTLVLSAQDQPSADLGSEHHEECVARALLRHQLRVRQLLAVAEHSGKNLAERDPVLARLVIAADQFVAARPEAGEMQENWPLQLSPKRKTIIAGYPWFTDWGRDSMISLPGLLLATGRYSEARGLLKAFASYMYQGLIPNRFPDNGQVPEYNTVDATLWMFHALDRYLRTTSDWKLLKELFPALQESIQWHIRGTLYGIGVDPEDGLLCAGAPGVQLTWMDARVDDWVVTPRRGKPVEVNALWYYALTAMESWAIRLSTDATLYSQLRTQVRQHFASRFWYEAGGYLYDVVDVDAVAGRNDASLRPNQLFAISLTRDLLSEAQSAGILKLVSEQLLTPPGLRSLSPTDPVYHRYFNGDRRQRDGAYHQGAVWPWLIGPYIDAHLLLNNDRTTLRPLLQPLLLQLWEACLGTISEVAEPEAPFAPAGCFAQAWSVAELLRCWRLVNV
ncbi:glycogen debranching protein [Ktedonosporobacter rubrisoli]|uniref:Glycogen debranching protein n=1 Tax=Ktedonosporobacter rubrisoli TaxID=2509675 RepID=A0A4P6K2M8_KTERU|nr:amylo-alpha-1,6-glucosidase [Ktedonosporobacter rubrisoli]QBD81960.1 glycogen debranching protein [Ktedonosporobacter rubrisoli]